MAETVAAWRLDKRARKKSLVTSTFVHVLDDLEIGTEEWLKELKSWREKLSLCFHMKEVLLFV